MQKKQKSKSKDRGVKALLTWFRNMFLAGLAVALPIAVTVGVIALIAYYLKEAGEPLQRLVAFWVNVFTRRRGQENAFAPEDFNLLIGLFLPVLIILALGVMATNVIGRQIVTRFDRLVETIPLVNFIYRAIQQAVSSFRNRGKGRNFKRVAFIEYPSPGCRLIGFVTGGFYDHERGVAVTSVFVPTSPNPMTGFVVIVDDDKVIATDMTLEDATKMVLSVGLVAPAQFTPQADSAPAEDSLTKSEYENEKNTSNET